MIYPLTERRISGYDRRNNVSEECTSSQGNQNGREYGTASERRNGEDRRVLKLDREKLLESITQKGNKAFWHELTIPGLISIVIACVSLYATHELNKQQEWNARHIAEADRAHSRQIAEAELESQRVEHLAVIFSGIVDLIKEPPEKFESNKDVLRHSIKSMSVYGDDALPFLIQLRDEYQQPKGVERAETIFKVAESTIQEVLLKNQPKIERIEIVGKENMRLRLPKREYINYNLTGSKFKNVNLFEADFSTTSLPHAEFKDVDLRGAHFSNAHLTRAAFENTNLTSANFDYANLRRAEFKEVNLRQVDFEKAYLDGATFRDCENLEFARFSIETLLQTDRDPIKSIPPQQYSLLLLQYEKHLPEIYKNNSDRLKKVYDKLNLADFDSLMSKFGELRKAKT